MCTPARCASIVEAPGVVNHVAWGGAIEGHGDPAPKDVHKVKADPDAGHVHVFTGLGIGAHTLGNIVIEGLQLGRGKGEVVGSQSHNSGGQSATRAGQQEQSPAKEKVSLLIPEPAAQAGAILPRKV